MRQPGIQSVLLHSLQNEEASAAAEETNVYVLDENGVNGGRVRQHRTGRGKQSLRQRSRQPNRSRCRKQEEVQTPMEKSWLRIYVRDMMRHIPEQQVTVCGKNSLPLRCSSTVGKHWKNTEML